jgi:hypothetical protein
MIHSPADIVRYALVGLEVGTLPSAGGTWPISVNKELDTPDETVTVFDTTGKDDGRSMYDGTRDEHPGVMLRIRAQSVPAAHNKASELATLLDTLYQEEVSIGEESYLLHSVTRVGNPIPASDPNSERKLFTVNCLVCIYNR